MERSLPPPLLEACGDAQTERAGARCGSPIQKSARGLDALQDLRPPERRKTLRVLECGSPLCTLHGFLSHSGFRSASDPTSQPHVTAVDRSAARYTCYAQRNGPGSGSSITCPLCLGARARHANVSVTRPVRDTLHLLRSVGRSTRPTASQVRFLASQPTPGLSGQRPGHRIEKSPASHLLLGSSDSKCGSHFRAGS